MGSRFYMKTLGLDGRRELRFPKGSICIDSSIVGVYIVRKRDSVDQLLKQIHNKDEVGY